MSYFLRHHGLQHTRLLCPPLCPRVCSNSCPLSQWCYLTILSSATFFFFLQSFPESRSFPMYWLFASGGQSIGASASILPMDTQGWLALGLTGLISLLSKSLSRIHRVHQKDEYHGKHFTLVVLTLCFLDFLSP